MNIPLLINKYVGQSLSYDRIEASRGQCAQWAEFVLTDTQFGYGFAPFWGNAIDWWSRFDGSNLSINFERVPISQDKPRAGDFVIYDASIGSIYGHINFCTRDWNGTNFMAYDSNWDGDKTVHQVVHNLRSVIGMIRLKGANDMIPDDDNSFYRWSDMFVRFRGRSPSREEFRKSAVGLSWLRAVEILTDGAEAAEAQHAQEVGQVAIRDNWSQQIADLLVNLKASQDDATAWKQNFATLQKQIDGLNAIKIMFEAKVTENAELTKRLTDVTKLADSLQSDNTALKHQLADADSQIKDPNKIVVTDKGWKALFVAIKSFFQKNN